MKPLVESKYENEKTLKYLYIQFCICHVLYAKLKHFCRFPKFSKLKYDFLYHSFIKMNDENPFLKINFSFLLCYSVALNGIRLFYNFQKKLTPKTGKR
ncbi:hypothetical protein BC781_102324 [Sediminitomix flava]|uniref:Uncharacterized protein n=1 Tax=Sediminitomix flava TaxID=379075 RepID=A0A315ZD53_SEDFL|nr:hypothetical protein BC781_102324 [Sediminitomix flava]